MKAGIGKILKTVELLFVLVFVYLELAFHIIRFGFTGNNILQKIIFSVFYGTLVGILISFIPSKAQKIVTAVVLFFCCFYFVVQIVFSGVFGTYLSVTGSVGVAGQALDFTDVIANELKREWWAVFLMLIPFVFYVVFYRKIVLVKRHEPIVYGLCLAGLIMTFTVAIVVLNSDKDTVYSSYEVYRDYPSVDMAVAQLGVGEALCLDLKNYAEDRLGISRKNVTFVAEGDYSVDAEKEDENASAVPAFSETQTCNGVGTIMLIEDENGVAFKEKVDNGLLYDTSPNVLDIDLNMLIAEEKNSNIAAIHTYVNSLTPTNKNKYTGMFEGYNLIFIVAEGFSGYVIDPIRTPTLYKMKTKGFCFNNYYTPLWYGSTLGGEYADLTGLMPKNGGYLSMARTGSKKNDMMFTLSRQLLKQNYTVMGFHNNDYTYYDRHISHTNMGYEWIGVGNGYEPERSGNGTILWPQSDLAMIEQTFDLYKDKEPFHIYYLTVSGHVMYNFGGNAMAARHKDIVENLNYTEATKAYIACQYELELALTALNEKLEEEGIADKTLIVVTADHVPYDNKEIVDELAGRQLDNTFEWYKNTLIIYSASMENSVDVGKYCSSIDILPTISNLMGLPYDSRMLVGQDILSDSEGLVMFNDRSFITDRCSYNANTGEVKSIDGSPIDDAYVETKIAQVKNKFSMAESICYYDYYRYIDEIIGN